MRREQRGRKQRREREDKTCLVVGMVPIPLHTLLLIPLEGGRQKGLRLV